MKKIFLFLFAVLCSTSMFAWKVSSNFVVDTWSVTEELTGESYTSDNLEANKVYKFKIQDGGSWKGFEDLDASTIVYGIFGDDTGNCNICIRLKEAGKVTITYKGGKIVVTGNFYDTGMKLNIWGRDDDPMFTLSSDKRSATCTIKADTLKENTDLKVQLLMPGGYISDYQGLSRTRTESNVFYANMGSMNINLDEKGDYVLTYNFATRKLSIVYPELITRYYVYGNFGSDDTWYDYEMTEASGVWSAAVTPAIERTQYEFKIRTRSGFYAYTYYGAQNQVNEMKKTNCTNWTLTNVNEGWNINMTPDIAGPYKFQYTPVGAKLDVTYPALETYMEFDGDHTLTYYYDNLRNTRAGVTEVYRPNYTYPVRDGYDNTKVTKVVVDKSMKNAELIFTYYMFGRGNEETGLPNVEVIEGLSNLNTSKVTNMHGMFGGCKKLVSLDLSTFNTANVENISDMFYDCESLASVTFGNFNTAKVTDMSNMFSYCYALTSLDLSSFNFDKLSNAWGMFRWCKKLETIYCDQDLSTSTVLTESTNMFDACSKLVGGNGTVYDSGNKDNTWARVDRGTGNEGYFTAPKKVYTVYTDGNKTLTYYCDSKYVVREGTVKIYDPSESDHFSSDYAPKVEKIVVDASMADTLLTSMDYLFSSRATGTQLANATEITGLNYLNTTKVTSMDWMFYGCAKLKVLYLNSFETPNLTNMGHMFTDCSELETLDLSSFNTAKVKITRETFYKCAKLRAINLTKADFSKVTNMTRMFLGASELVTIWCNQDLSKNSFGYDGNGGVFENCTKIEGEKGTKYNTSYINADYARPDKGAGSEGYFTSTDTLQTLIDEVVESLNDLITKPLEAAQEIVNNAINDVKAYDWELNKTLLFNVSGFNYMYDENWYMGIKNQVFNAYDYDLKKRALAKAISELQDLNDFAAGYATAEQLKPIKDQITAAQAVLNDPTSTLQQLTDAEVTASNALKADVDIILPLAKEMANKALEDLGEEGDSEACKQIIEDAKAEVNKLAWSIFQNVKQNTERITKAAEDIYEQTKTALEEQRKKDTAAGMESLQPSAVSCQKTFRDGQLLIRRGEKTYTATGAEVR